MSRRKEDFRADVPVILADGQTWFLPRPRIRLRPKIVDGKATIAQENSFGLEYMELVSEYYRTQADEGNWNEWIVASFDLAVSVLLRNYELSPEEIESLIYFDFSEPPDPLSREMFETFRDVSLGIQKKTSPDSTGLAF